MRAIRVHSALGIGGSFLTLVDCVGIASDGDGRIGDASRTSRGLERLVLFAATTAASRMYDALLLALGLRVCDDGGGGCTLDVRDSAAVTGVSGTTTCTVLDNDGDGLRGDSSTVPLVSLLLSSTGVDICNFFSNSTAAVRSRRA